MSDVERKVLVARLRDDTVKERVAVILAEYPDTRGDDFILALRFYKRFYAPCRSWWNLFQLAVKGRAPNPETLARRRRELVYDDGHVEWLPREGTQRKRWKNQDAYLDYYGCRPLSDFEF